MAPATELTNDNTWGKVITGSSSALNREALRLSLDFTEEWSRRDGPAVLFCTVRKARTDGLSVLESGDSFTRMCLQDAALTASVSRPSMAISAGEFWR